MKKIKNLKQIFLIGILTFSLLPIKIYADTDSFDSSNYTLVDYVTPSGSGVYVNTSYQPNQNTRIVAQLSNNGSNTGFYYGVTTTVSGSARSLGFKNGSSNYQIRTMNSNSNVNISGSKYSDGTVFTIDQGNTVTTITDGNTTLTSSTYSYGNYTLGNMFIFGLNNGGFVTGNQYARLYDFKIYESNSLVHHYYPCIRNSDSSVGLYDGVTDTFLSSSGGNLSYGSIATTQYTITTSVSPSGSGTVSGGGTYNSGTVITLTASASSGYSFSSWSDGDTTNPRSITVNSNQTYTAQFVADSPTPTQYTITTSVSPSGSGTVSGGGTYNSGTVITLTANASSGFVFGSWSDGSTVNPRQVQVTSNASYTALFTQDLSNQIVLGSNLRIIDYERQYVITSYQGTLSGSGVLFFGTQGNTTYEYAIYEIEVILNNEYVGSVVVNGVVNGNNVNNAPFSRTVYLNGNSFKFVLGPYTNSSVSISSVTFDTSNLSLKESTVNAIYNGTQDTIESTNDLDDSTGQFSDLSSDVFDIEGNLTSGFSTSMNDIPTTFSFSSFGSSFVTSASWVRDQFNNLTVNNPFGTLISFSLLLGVGLLIIGRIL